MSGDAMRLEVHRDVAGWFPYVGLVTPHTGLAWVRNKHGREFHIFADGRRAYAMDFDKVGSFYEHFAIATVNNQHFHIDVHGKPFYKERYHDVGPFHNGRARICDGRRTFFINNKGQEVS